MLLVVSPHLDDAVLSASDLLAGATDAVVVTAFSAKPAPGTVLTEWDAASGFADSDGVMAVRLAEDAAAMEIVGATARHLGELDGHYSPGPGRPGRVGRDLAAVLGELAPRTCAIPLGIAHPDHVEVRDVALDIARRRRQVEWLAYADLPYAHAVHGALDTALGQVHAAGFAAEPHAVPHAGGAVKRAAVACYPTQLRALRAQFPAADPGGDRERYWRLTRR